MRNSREYIVIYGYLRILSWQLASISSESLRVCFSLFFSFSVAFLFYCRTTPARGDDLNQRWKEMAETLNARTTAEKCIPVIMIASVAGRLEILPHEMFANNTSLRGCQIGPYTHTNSVKFRNFSRNGFANFWKSEKV